MQARQQVNGIAILSLWKEKQWKMRSRCVMDGRGDQSIYLLEVFKGVLDSDSLISYVVLNPLNLALNL